MKCWCDDVENYKCFDCEQRMETKSNPVEIKELRRAINVLLELGLPDNIANSDWWKLNCRLDLLEKKYLDLKQIR